MKIIHICGMAHSGSTLLGLLLGAHSKCFYAGEAKNSAFLNDQNIKVKKKTCKYCGNECNIWSNIDSKFSVDIYSQLAKLTNSEVIVDSTKDCNWIKEQIINNDQHDIFLIYLKRDERAVVNSRKRKYKNADFDEIIDFCINEKNKAESLYHNFKGEKTIIQYRNLACDTASELIKLCNSLNIQYEASMLDWQNMIQHPIGGNNGTQWLFRRNQNKQKSESQITYYANHPGGIIEDLRWKYELTNHEQATINKRFSQN